jgi:hypothetical protein
LINQGTKHTYTQPPTNIRGHSRSFAVQLALAGRTTAGKTAACYALRNRYRYRNRDRDRLQKPKQTDGLVASPAPVASPTLFSTPITIAISVPMFHRRGAPARLLGLSSQKIPNTFLS